MKNVLLLVFLPFSFLLARGQQVDSIFFHLYTDSLKKGTHNYINVDGKMHDGRWKPLTAREISFSSSHGVFEGNDLVLPVDFAGEKITVTAVLKADTSLRKQITIWIKKKQDDEQLPTKEEVMRGKSRKSRGN